jgi:hypothetical protein
MQRVVVFSLGELRLRPSWCAGGSRVMDAGGRRGEGNGRSPAALRTTRGEFGGGQVRVDLNPRESGEALMARQVGRRSYGAKAAVRRDELGGASMQPSMATLPGKLLRQPRNVVIVELILSPILFIAGIHFPHVLLHNQGYPKVCPDSLNLSNAGDSFAELSSLSSCSCFPRPGT